MKSPSLLLAGVALLWSFAVTAQKVDLDKFTFNCEHIVLPQNYVRPDARSYRVNITASPRVQTIMPAADIYERVGIDGYQRADEGYTVVLDLNIGDIMLLKQEVKSRVDIKKDKEGKETGRTYYYSVNATYETEGSYAIMGPKMQMLSERQKEKVREKEAAKSDNPFLKGDSPAGTKVGDLRETQRLDSRVFYTGPEFKSGEEASRNFRINELAIRSKLLTDYIVNGIASVNSRANYLYGYVPHKDVYHLWILDSKNHPEYEMQQHAIKAVKELMEGMRAHEDIAQLKKQLEPVMTYFEGLKTKYTGGDKGDKKMRYSAYYNLAKLHLLLDNPDKAMKEARNLIANDYDEKDGEALLEQAEELKYELEFHKMSSRHLTSL